MNPKSHFDTKTNTDLERSVIEMVSKLKAEEDPGLSKWYQNIFINILITQAMYKIRCFLSFFNGDKDLRNPSIEIESSFIPRMGEIFILSASQLSEMNSAVEKNSLKYPFFENSEWSLYLQDYIHVASIQYTSDQICMHLSYYPSDMMNVDIHIQDSLMDVEDTHISIMINHIPRVGEFLNLSTAQYEKLSQVIESKENVKIESVEDYNKVNEVNYSSEDDCISIYLTNVNTTTQEKKNVTTQIKKRDESKKGQIIEFIRLFKQEFFSKN